MARKRFVGRSRSQSERGDTLIELIIAVVIIALAIVPLLGLMIEMLAGSAEHRSLSSLNTLMKGFAETVKSEVQLSPPAGGPAFANCGTVNYKLLSLPTPQTAAPGAAVTIFATGFNAGIGRAAFTVKVGGITARKTTKRSQPASGTEMGNMQLTFFVPAGLSGLEPILVSDGIAGQTVTSTAATSLRVTAGATASTVSPLGRYTMGVKLVRYWNPGKSTETKPLTDCVLNSGVQLLTVHARAGDGVGDTLTFALRNPSPAHIPIATPSVSISATPVFAALPTSPSTSNLVFTAVVTPAAGNRRPTQPVKWLLTEAGSTSGCPAASGPTNGSDNASIYKCTITLTSASATGRYSATATYPKVTPSATTPGNTSSSWIGFSNVYGANGGGTATVSPTSVAHGATGQTFTFTYTAAAGGMNSGELTITVPTAPAPQNWTPPQSLNSAAAGYTTAMVGATAVTVVTTGDTIQVQGLTLAAGTTVKITYGAGGGVSGVTAPSQTGPYTFHIEQDSVPGGALTPLAAPPIVTVS